MAEIVQGILDQMVAPLRDLLEKGIFSESEIRAIVSRRRQSEYLLYRRSPRKADYLRYIEAEIALERLRSLRQKRVMAEKRAKEAQKRREEGVTGNHNSNNNNDNGDNDAHEKKQQKNRKADPKTGEAHIVRHVHFIYQRMIRKFPDDVSLRLQYAEFAKSVKSFTTLGRIYAEALQVHPRNVTLWIEAASHEFFGHITDDSTGGISGAGSVRNARILLQRGLRINNKSQELWLQYFVLEFHYIQKLRGRRKVLRALVRDEEDGGAKFIRDVRHENDNDNEEEENDEEADESFKEARIPRIVYKNAIQAIPDDVTFRLKFLDLCQMFPETEVAESDIMSSIERDFAHIPDAWIVRAVYTAEHRDRLIVEREDENKSLGFLSVVPRSKTDDREKNEDSERHKRGPLKKRKREDMEHSMNGYDSDDEVLRLLEQATDAIRTPEMYVKCVQFVKSYMQQILYEEKAAMDDVIDRQADIACCVDFLGHLFKKANDSGIKSSDLVLEQSTYLVNIGEARDALDVLETYSSSTEENHPKVEARVWLEWARLSQRFESAGLLKTADAGTRLSPINILRMAEKRIPIHDRGHMAILIELFQYILILPPSHLNKKKKQQSRQKEISDLFQRILLLCHNSEYQAPKSNNQDSPEQSTTVASIPKLCLQYLQYSCTMGGPDAARSVYETTLFKSNYATSSGDKRPDEVEGMKIFFDACICLEKSSSTWSNSPNNKRVSKTLSQKKALKESKRRLSRLYDAAINFFQGGGDYGIADSYRRRRADDVVYS